MAGNDCGIIFVDTLASFCKKIFSKARYFCNLLKLIKIECAFYWRKNAACAGIGNLVCPPLAEKGRRAATRDTSANKPGDR